MYVYMPSKEAGQTSQVGPTGQKVVQYRQVPSSSSRPVAQVLTPSGTRVVHQQYAQGGRPIIRQTATDNQTGNFKICKKKIPSNRKFV